MVAPRGLDRLESEFLSQRFRSRPSARQRGVIKECDLARRSLDGPRRSLARSGSGNQTAPRDKPYGTFRHRIGPNVRECSDAGRPLF